MKSGHQHYSGSIESSKEVESFSISIGWNTPETIVPNHSHEKPYLCLCLDGTYTETNYKTSTLIDPGACIFRSANYEHANQFYEYDVKLLNVEINNPTEFMEENDFKLPESEILRKGTLDLYRLLYSYKLGVSDDLLNILCYESTIKHFDMLPVRGKLDWVRKVKERILDDPFTSISLSRFSREFNLHPNYIVRKFKAITGYRLSEYLNKTRVELSLKKMIQSDDSLTNIAVDSGFCDQSHFNRNFRKHFSDSPKKIRKLLKG